MKAALEEVFQKAGLFISEGATFIVLTDRNMGENMAPIPSLLATAGLHQYLIRKDLRSSAGLIVETGEARQPMHFAILIGYGANAVCPNVAYSTVRDLAETMYEKSVTPDAAADSYITAIKKGIPKTMSRMGISTVHSFFGAQIFEAVGIGRELLRREWIQRRDYAANTQRAAEIAGWIETARATPRPGGPAPL